MASVDADGSEKEPPVDGWDTLHRFASDLLGRTDGPMTFRFFLQPTMAFLTALHDGIRDARTGDTPYFWKITHSDVATRRSSLREGFKSVARVLLLGAVMDVIYQFKVFGGYRYPLETVAIVLLLAFVPYLLLRGPVARVAKWWMGRKTGNREQT